MGIPIIDIIGKIVDKVVPDPQAKMELQLELAKLADAQAEREHKELAGQIEVNKVEAAHSSIFVAGWRPFIGWSAGSGVAWSFVVAPVVEWVSRLLGWKGSMPELDSSQLMTLVLALLGMGGLRTYEKMKGVARETPASVPLEPMMIDSSAPVKKKKDLWPF